MSRLHINQKYCKGCHICISFCPKSALKSSEKMNEKGYFVPIQKPDWMSCYHKLVQDVQQKNI